MVGPTWQLRGIPETDWRQADDIDGMRAAGAPGTRIPRILPGSHPFE